ncbi:MAG: hydrolase [Frankiales bacterium]|nr:hydrolase [Frankiales bacterium]
MTVLDLPAAPTSGTLGGVSFVVLGEGGPTTVFAHGLGGSIAETRPLATRVAGTRVLLDFRGHGDSAVLEDGWDYDLLADDLLAVADHVGATQAVGLSLGSGALLRALARDPGRFTKVAFVLPAAIDSARRDGATERLHRLGAAIERQDARATADILLEELPDEVRRRRGVDALVLRRAGQLVTKPAPAPRHEDRPLPDRSVLARLTCPALVLAQTDDPLHPADLAAELAAALPASELVVLPEGGVFWTAAREAQSALARHLAED